MHSESSVMTSGAWLLVCAGVLVGGLGGGCTVDVSLGFPSGSCDADGITLENGENEPAPDGCNTCSCKDGVLICTALLCNPCPEGEPPVCADRPVDDLGCYAEPVCGPEGWQCVDTCPCAALTVPECPVPFEACYYEGPFCDGEQWSCGAPVCPTCADQPICPPPTDPLCFTDAYCSETLGWECQEVCPPECDEPPPKCLGVTFANCREGAWVCEGNATCGSELIDCPPSPYPYCSSYMECGQGGWLCQETCDLSYCQDEVPPCEPAGPSNCSSYPTCTSQGWLCAETCM